MDGQSQERMDVPLVPLISDEASSPSPTDTTPGTLFIGGLVVFILITMVAMTSGKLQYLNSSPNYDGHYCGVDDPVRGLPYVYYPLNPAVGVPELMMDEGQCVGQCPGIEDVGKPIPVIMTQFEDDPLTPGQSALVVKYTVQSPMYASSLYAGSLCMPMEANLQSSFISSVATTKTQIRAALGTLQHSWAAVFRDVTFALVLTTLIGFIALPSIPRLTVHLTAVVGAVGAFAYAFYALWWCHSEGPSLPQRYGDMYSQSITASGILGVIMIGYGIRHILTLTLNWGIISDAINAYKATRGVITDVGRTQIVIPILLGVVFTAISVLISVISLLASITIYNRVGGIGTEAFPVHLQAVTFPPRILLCIMFTICFGILLLNIVRSAARWCGAYQAVVWYFSPPLVCGCDQRDVPAIEAFRALHGMVTLSLGTSVLYAVAMSVAMPITRLFAFFSRRKSPHFSPPDGDHLSDAYVTTTKAESNGAAAWTAERLAYVAPTLAAVCEFFHAASLAENILSGSDLLPAMGMARQRMVQRNNLVHPPSAGHFISSFGCVSEICSFSIAVISSFTSFLTLSARAVYPVTTNGEPAVRSFGGYSIPESEWFVSNPALAAYLVFAIVFLAADCIFGFLEGIVDGTLYCYIVDVQSEADGYNSPTGHGLADEQPGNIERAPTALRMLLGNHLINELGLCVEVEQNKFCNDQGYHMVGATSPHSPTYHMDKLDPSMRRRSFDIQL